MNILILGSLLVLQSAGPPQNTADSHPRIDPSRIRRMELQEVTLEDFPAEGWILDIGGGGEGVIGRLKGQQVVAIDLSARELNGTPSGPLKLVMDATDSKFLDSSFNTVTSFFTLMYMDPAAQEKAVREAFRVLTPGGRLRIWEVHLPALADPKKDVAVFPFRFRLPSQTVQTGYGTRLPRAALDANHYARLVEHAGFSVEQLVVEEQRLRLVAQKR